MTISQRDKAAIWHPFTQHQMVPFAKTIASGKGAYLFDQEGKRLLDLISSWWVNLHGHAHPDIAKAIYDQALRLPHVQFANFTHQPAVQLAEDVLALLPPLLSKVFYSDNGSTAVEVAIKMAYQYWQNVGEPQRKKFISFEKGYHGDTFGAMALGQRCGFFDAFSELLFSVQMIPYPATWLNDDKVQQKEQEALVRLDDYLSLHGHETAAIILEPLVQGSSGMNMCRPQFLQALEAKVRKHGILVIYDEVMTGFGRTGDYFACLKADTAPDFICLAKGLTGGFLPLAMTACTDQIYQAFLGDSFASALAHGHTFTANPLGCAASLASLQILKKPETQKQIKAIEQAHVAGLAYLATEADIIRTRYCGTIAAFDLPSEEQYGSALSVQLRERFYRRGLLLRPLGNTIYLLPPYCVTAEELQQTYSILAEEIQGVLA